MHKESLNHSSRWLLVFSPGGFSPGPRSTLSQRVQKQAEAARQKTEEEACFAQTSKRVPVTPQLHHDQASTTLKFGLEVARKGEVQCS